MIFKRTVEDFVCGHCNAAVAGTGYTNHCPRCLWSKHVDVHPGDRAEACGGLMEPVRLEGSSPTYDIIHSCISCKMERKNRMATSDDPEKLLALAKRSEFRPE